VIGYVNAGTVEFLLDQDGKFYFLEMNTRLQVEHPVTEEVTGIDLVRLQLDIAEGKPLPFKQEEIHPRGAAIECRIVAEDPEAGFMPASGPILWARLPQGPGIRNDVGFEAGGEVSVYYDSMIGKLITRGRDREEARVRMLRALEEYTIEGVRTNLVFQRWVLSHPDFISGNTYTRWVDECFRPNMLKDGVENGIFAQVAAVAAFRDRMGPGGIGVMAAANGNGAGAASVHDPLAPRISSWKRPGRSSWTGR
jgi:acetyl/propionyl-CoA carboxylase alpha subunit